MNGLLPWYYFSGIKENNARTLLKFRSYILPLKATRMKNVFHYLSDGCDFRNSQNEQYTPCILSEVKEILS